MVSDPALASFVLQVGAGYVSRIDARRHLRAIRLDGIGYGDELAGVAIAQGHQRDRRERNRNGGCCIGDEPALGYRRPRDAGFQSEPAAR
jgi:hypothetical protein